MTYFKDKKVGGPKWIAGDEEHEEALAECGVSVEAAWRIPGRPVRWLVENVIADEAVTVIAGDAGTGKTFFACQLAADAARISQCRVVLATSGSESAELLRWRLDQADADPRRIALAILTPPKGFNDRSAGPSAETIDERMALLYHTLLGAGDATSGILPGGAGKTDEKTQNAEEESQIAKYKSQKPNSEAATGATCPQPEGEGDHNDNPKSKIQNPKFDMPELPRAAELLVIDDVDGWFGKPGQCVSAAALARVIQRLNELARSLHVAVVVLVRAPMSVEGRITSRQLSRLAQSANVVWMIVKDRQGSGFRVQGSEEAEDGRQAAADGCPTDNPKPKIENPKSSEPVAYRQSDRRWLLPVKNNLAPDVATIGRAFELFDGQIRWHGDDPAPSLAEATLPSVHNSDRRRLRHAAAAWLEEALSAGPLPSKELYRQGLENGFSLATLKRAATELGIQPHKTGFDGGWEMRWTPQPVVRGRGTTARRAGAGFKIFEGDREDVSRRGGEWETEGKADGGRQKAEEGAAATHDPSCASSAKRGDSSKASCASSNEGKAVSAAVRPYPGPLPKGEGADASCASSEKRGDSSKASCEPSGEWKNVAAVQRSEVDGQCKMQNATCKTQNDACGSDVGSENRPPRSQDPGPPTDDCNPKSKIENPKSEDDFNIYAVIVDALREACFQKAC